MSALRFPSLDGLRCLSIIPVIWHHSTQGPLEGALGKGPLGVDLFFAISGFIITTLLLREKAAAGDVSVWRFYARRSLRIFPLYYVILGLYVIRAAIWLPIGPQRAHFFASLPYYASYTSNWFVDFGVSFPVIFAFSWSLATEEQFYLIWPHIVKRGRGWLLPVLVLVLLFALDQAVEHGYLTTLLPPGGLARRMAVSIASPICLGAILAYALHSPRGFAALDQVLGARWSAPLALFALILFVCTDGAPLVVVHMTLAWLVGACCIRPDHGISALTDAAPMRWIGTVSYGMYLIHVAAITAAKRILPEGSGGAPFVFALAFPAALALASVSYTWFERPILRLRDHFRANPALSPSEK